MSGLMLSFQLEISKANVFVYYLGDQDFLN